MMKEVETNEIESDIIESYHINLPYLKKKCYNKDIELEKLCKLFVIEEEEIHNLKGDEIMEEALNELEKLSQDEKIIGLYDKEKVEQKVINTRLEGAKLEGISEGKKEAKLEVAKNLLNLNINLDDIISSTGLTKEELEKLQ